MEFIAKCDFGPGARKTLRKAKYPEMETCLYAWFCTQRSRDVPISYEILSAKARQLYTETYGNDNFRASRGWIFNFRKRHGLRALKVCGEKLSNDQSTVDPFLTAFAEKIKELNLGPTQIYNADESALYWKMLPEKTLVRSQEKTAPGRKISKERVTFLVCCNADGSQKLKLLVVGKAKNPRAFKNVNLPVEYKSSANAWMTTAIFLDWFHFSFIRQVRSHLRSLNLPERALLIVDNASNHGSTEELTSEDGQFTTLFLSPNCTALLQPMDQNAIRLTKLFYRKRLLAHILSSNEENVVKLLKTIKGRYVSNMLNVLSEQNLTDVEISNWIENDEDLLPLEDVDSDVGGIDEQRESDNEGSEMNNTNQTVKVITNDEAVKSFNGFVPKGCTYSARKIATAHASLFQIKSNLFCLNEDDELTTEHDDEKEERGVDIIERHVPKINSDTEK
ncbi:jerky protein homolog-like [Sitophilus oryzae]|uniref:Jerky protein homolog-like n=1 Tax=Sitophilus oryzae TaxID=7048 RepID=A0A6J2YAB1_SITOR|nr:jerky protein homolog-like [Sitophilus oryzae]